jgi:tetratricopeptide (TPR) repeat protein
LPGEAEGFRQLLLALAAFAGIAICSSQAKECDYHQNKLKPMWTQTRFTRLGRRGGVWSHVLRAGLLVLLLPACRGGVFAQSHPQPAVAAEAEKAETEGDTDRALALYEKAVKQSPAWTEGWWRYGGLLYESKQYRAAEQAFARLTELAPENSLGFALLGLCEFEQSDWNNAALHLNKALNRGGLPPDVAHVTAYDFGLVLLQLKNREGAILVFKLLMHQAPNYPNLTLALGAAELGLQAVPSAQDPVLPAAQLAGESAVAVLKNEPANAEKLYRQLIAEFPAHPFAHLCLGEFLESEHRDDEAAKEFQAETVVNPDSAVPWLWLSRVALVQEDPQTARSAAARARTLDPDNPLTFLIEGRSFMLEHRWEQALVPLREAERRAPQSSEVHFALASAYAALHRDQAAKLERQLFLEASRSDSQGEGSTLQ